MTGGGTYEYGEEVYIKATPVSGYTFSMWSDGYTSASRYITINSNKTLTAYFTSNSVSTYKLTLLSSPSYGGSVTGGGDYEYGEKVHIKATPAYGYTFSKWSDGSTTSDRYIYLYGNKTLTAYFVSDY